MTARAVRLRADGATWVEVRDLSLNFWFVGPSVFGGAFPVVHPGLEAIFNVVLAWSALFAGFAADGRRGRPQEMLPTLLGMQFLTNAFFLPYLATRPSEEDGAVVALDELSPVERATESRALPFCSAASARWRSGGSATRGRSSEVSTSASPRCSSSWPATGLDRRSSSTSGCTPRSSRG